jgi:mono/diheme cytochrome c family protein/glucose/arabinose dehydrogenase
MHWQLCVSLLWAMALPAQNGDRIAADKRDMPPGIDVPPAVVLAPDDALAAMQLQPGFRMELCAAEPLVRDPVAMTFDAAGRMWVVEMNTYMPDIDANGELEAASRIAVLHDDNDDGVMDRAEPFLEGVVLPRAVLPIRAGRPGGGALVILPPKLVWAVDHDGDLRADELVDVAGGFDAGLQNPEHSGNGLLWGRDNRIHLANDRRTWRCVVGRDGELSFGEEPGSGGGQWGISQDDRGRTWFNYNSDWLRCNLVPGHYAGRAPDLRMAGLNHRAVADQTVHPVRVTPGVNRGGRDGVLDERAYLARTTAVCSPLVYRGDALGDCDGSVFVCEPAGHVVRRFVIEDGDGRLAARNAYADAEFLAATDERFRPVSLGLGPDGALYVVDMYRGVIQHRNFVTTWLRKQVEARGLERPVGMGRIWRIVAEGHRRSPTERLDRLPLERLVDRLFGPCGHTRDVAQRELVLRADRRAVPLLRRQLREHGDAVGRLAVLAVLDGLDAVATNDLRVLADAEDSGLVAFAAGLCASHVTRVDKVLLEQLGRWAAHPSPSVQWHVALALGSVEGPLAARALEQLVDLAEPAEQDVVLRDCIRNACWQREADLVRALGRRRNGDRFTTPLLLQALGAQVARSRQRERQRELLDVTAGLMEVSSQQAVLRGFLSVLPKEPDKQPGFFKFAVTPQSLVAMKRIGDPGLVELVDRMLSVMTIQVEEPPPSGLIDADLSPEERGRIAAGARAYGMICAACHQADGRGMAGLAPPLRGSDWVTGDAETLVKIVLHGVRGPIEAAGVTFDGEMPSQAHFADEDLAAALSWLRRAWGSRATPISPAEIKALRDRLQGHEVWSAAELRRR